MMRRSRTRPPASGPKRGRAGRSTNASSTRWAPDRFAAIPTTVLDPPLVRRLPRSPRLWVRVPNSKHRHNGFSSTLRGESLALSNPTEFSEKLRTVLPEVAEDALVFEQANQIATGNHQQQMVGTKCLLRELHFAIELG